MSLRRRPLGSGFLPGRVWCWTLEKVGGYGSSLPRGECLRGGRVWVGRLGGSRAPNGLFCTPPPRVPTTRTTGPMDAMDDQPLHLQRDMTPSTHIEACMTMSVRRRSATRTALVTSALVTSALVTYGLEDPIWYGRRQGGGGVWHRPSQRASSRSRGVRYSTRQGSSTIPLGQKSGTPRR